MPPIRLPAGADLFTFLSIPFDQRALTHFELLGDAAQAPALGSEFEELVSGVVVIRNARFRQSVMGAPDARRGRVSPVFGPRGQRVESELH